MPRFSVSVTDEQDAWVEQQAAERDRSKSEIIRLLIDVHRTGGEEFTTAVNAGGSAAVQGGEPATDAQSEPSPSTRELAAQLSELTDRLDDLERAVTTPADTTPAEATDRDTDTPASEDGRGQPQSDESSPEMKTESTPAGTDRPPQSDVSTDSTASANRSVPEPNEDGIIEAGETIPEDDTAEHPAEPATEAADAATEETDPTAEEADGVTEAAEPPTEAAEPPTEHRDGGNQAETVSDTEATTSTEWPTGDSHPDPQALDRTAYSDRPESGSPDSGARGDDTPAGPTDSLDGTAPAADPGETTSGQTAQSSVSGTDAEHPGQSAERGASDAAVSEDVRSTDDSDLLYADQDGDADESVAAEEDAGDVADDEPAAIEHEDTESDDATTDETAADDGPFGGMGGDADPAAVQAAIEDAIDDPTLADAVFRCWKQLRDRGTAHRRIFKSHYEDTDDGYDSPDAWWRDVSDHFESLPGVEAPPGGGNFYRYRYNK